MKKSSQSLLSSLFLKWPIIQAPMAGGSCSTELITSVCKFGCLGSLPSAYLSHDNLKIQIKNIKNTINSNHFAINAFIPNEINTDKGNLDIMKDFILKQENELNINSSNIPPLPTYSDIYNEYEKTIDIIIKEKPLVFSFTFGIPDENIIKEMKSQGIFIIGTATNLEEAILLENSYCDAIIAQGIEAGGHRGTFLNYNKINDISSAIGLFPLLSTIINSVSIPVIAAGGIMDEKDIISCLQLGASCVQMGTAFLGTKESCIPSCYKDILYSSSIDNTLLTNSFSGRYARGIENKFIKQIHSDKFVKDSVLDFPLQNILTTRLRTKAKESNNPEYISLWAGQGVSKLKKEQSVYDFLNNLTSQLNLQYPYWKSYLSQKETN